MTEYERAVKLWESMENERLDMEGHYACIVDTSIRGYVVMATTGSDGALSLRIHRNRDLMRWYRRSKRHQQRYPDDDALTAMYATQED